MSRFAPSFYWNCIVDGPLAPLMFHEFLKKAMPTERIRFAMVRLSNFQTLLDPIGRDMTTCVRGRRAVELNDSGVQQLLEILHVALYEKYKAAGHEVFLKYSMGLFWRLPAVAPAEDENYKEIFILAYPDTKKSIVNSVVNRWPSHQPSDPWSRALFRFLTAAYVGREQKAIPRGPEFYGRQEALEEMQKYIEGLLRTKAARMEREDILLWTQESNLPKKFWEIILVALLKKTDLAQAKAALQSLVTTS